jgi:putative transposase
VLLWDRFNPHRSAGIRLFLSQSPRLHVLFFPPYAPELNPTENFWSYLKTNPLANAALPDLPSLIHKTRHHSRSIQRSIPLLRSFVQHSPLSLRLK